MGLDTLAASLGEDSGTIEDVYEPYLVQNGFCDPDTKGRMVTDLAYQHFGIEKLQVVIACQYLAYIIYNIYYDT